MPECKHCHERSSKLNAGQLCKTCFTEVNRDQVKRRDDGKASNHANNTTEIPVNDGDVEKEISDIIDLDKPTSELSVRDLITLFKTITKPIIGKIEKSDKQFGKRVTSTENRITLLEAEMKQKDEKINMLTDIIINMQSSLNFIDRAYRKIICWSITSS